MDNDSKTRLFGVFCCGRGGGGGGGDGNEATVARTFMKIASLK